MRFGTLRHRTGRLQAAAIAIVTAATIVFAPRVGAAQADPVCAEARKRADDLIRAAGNNAFAKRAAQTAKNKANELCRERAAEQRSAGRRESEKGCADLRAWIGTEALPPTSSRTPSPDEGPDRAVSVLIADERFTPTFGKPYMQYTREELQQVAAALNQCWTSTPMRGLEINEREAARRALNPMLNAGYRASIVAREDARRRLTQLASEIQSLQATDADYQRLRAARVEGNRLQAIILFEERDAFDKAFGTVEQRVALPIEAARVSALLRSATGYDGLLALDALSDSLNFASYGSEVSQARRSHREQLLARMSAIAAPVFAAERARVDALGTGLPALEGGLRWRSEFNDRYVSLPDLPEMKAVYTYFLAQRAQTMKNAKPAFIRAAAALTSEESVDALVSRSLSEFDVSTREGGELVSAATWRKYDIHKRAVLARASSNARSMADTRAPSARAPNAEEMFDVLSLRLMGTAAGATEIAKECKSGLNEDMYRSLSCLFSAFIPSLQNPMRVTRFQRTACAPAQGRPGYVCDYVIAVAGGPMDMMGDFYNRIAASGENATARFVYSDGDEWIFYPERRNN